jgi:hypothetical protein
MYIFGGQRPLVPLLLLGPPFNIHMYIPRYVLRYVGTCVHRYVHTFHLNIFLGT